MILFLLLHILELLNEITITPPCESTCEEAPTAGDSHTLTCTVKSELPTNLNWVRIISETEQVVVENTPNITISKQTKSGLIPFLTSKSITFNPLLTSHAGKYACVSVLNNMGQRAIGTSQLECAVKVKSKYCYRTYIIHHHAYKIGIILYYAFLNSSSTFC